MQRGLRRSGDCEARSARQSKPPRLAIEYRPNFTLPHLSTAAVLTLGSTSLPPTCRTPTGSKAMVAEDEGLRISARTKAALAVPRRAVRSWALRSILGGTVIAARAPRVDPRPSRVTAAGGPNPDIPSVGTLTPIMCHRAISQFDIPSINPNECDTPRIAGWE